MSQSTSQGENGGKIQSEGQVSPNKGKPPIFSETDAFHDEANPFLVSITRNSRLHSYQQHRQNAPFIQDDIDNPFIVSTKSTNKQEYVDKTTAYLTSKDPGSPLASSTTHGSSSQYNSKSKTKSSGDSFDYQNVTTEDLKQARKELKTWELNFKNTHQRAATQDDISKDSIMVKKYRTYNKIKKALAAKEGTNKDINLPNSISIQDEGSTGTNTSKSEMPQTPKKTRNHRIEGITRTPIKKQDIEYISPREAVSGLGFMSPSKSNSSVRVFNQSSPGLTSPSSRSTRDLLASPSSQRTKNLLASPSRRTDRRLNFNTNSVKSPSSLFVINENVATEGSSTSDISLPAIDSMDALNPPGTSTPTRTPKHFKINNLYPGSPFKSPSRSRTSPLFGGMNNRKSKRAIRLNPSEAAEIESVLDKLHSSRAVSPSTGYADLVSDILFTKSPITSTPQKQGAAKAARSLFRSPGASYPTSPSTHRSMPSTPTNRRSLAPPKSPSVGRINRTKLPGRSLNHPSSPLLSATFEKFNNPAQDTVHGAMGSMTINEIGDSSQERKLVTHGFDTDSQWSNNDERNSLFEKINNMKSPEFDDSDFGSQLPPGLMSPSNRNRAYFSSTPRTPSQQPSLTFSQTTPGSAKSDADTMFVPAGIYSHYRRRTIRQSLFIPSQEEEERFEREYLGTTKSKESDVYSHRHGRAETSKARNATEDHAPGNNEASWEDHLSGSDDQDETLSYGKQALPKKKYTQKRTTRLHRIAVAPSENTESKRPIKMPRKRKPAISHTQTVSQTETHDGAVAVMPNNTQPESGDTLDSTDPVSVKLNSTTSSDQTAYGWANSNKPMTKSDKGIPGVGIGRAGPRRSTNSKFSSSVQDGNFVAYNLQRNGFKKGGARGKSRFSKYSSVQVTGRTAFDSESWRTEFDKDFDESTLAMSLLDDDLAVEDDEDDDEVPWYGNTNDTTDPFVVTISSKYLQGYIGDANDPDEYIQEMEEKAEKRKVEFKVNLEHILRKVWGYPSFRDGQLDSVKRVLNYESSLLVLPTGSGKSLSYQLPAYIFSKLGIPSLALVISPMISLMYDQVKCLPPGLPGACWTSVEQSASQFKDFMEKLTSNTIKILFISPEKLQSQSFLSLVRNRRIPPISFLCVDEAHCLSEWSHNFRPAYLLLNNILKVDLKSPCVLALTGTATEGTKDSICEMLDIDRSTGVLSGSVIRENLAMTVSLEVDREPALLNLLQSPRFAAMDSILIYVMKQSQADALAGFLRVRNFSAESYHAGKSAHDRQRIQQKFMHDNPQKSIPGTKLSQSSIGAGGSSNGIRVLVATIAFGLGLNKSNIRSVIHYCMPKSLENYIQEIGRSGRDGRKAYCHMFLSQDDYLHLRSLAYADGMDWGTVLRLFKKLFSRKGIVNISSTAHNKGAKTNSANKKKRNLSNDSSDELDSEEADSLDGLQAGSKKLKQNDHQPLSIKLLNAGTNNAAIRQNLVMSSASILVIPPASGMLSNTSHRQRFVVVREELIEEEFDIKKEVLTTLLSYIELDPSRPCKVLGSISAKCTVKFIQNSEAISELADTIPLIESIIKYGVSTGNNNNSRGGSSFGKGRRYGNKTGLAGTTLSQAFCCDTMSLCQEHDLTYSELVQELQTWKRKKLVVYELTDPALCVEILKEAADCMAESLESQVGQSDYAMDMDTDPEISIKSNLRASLRNRVTAGAQMEIDADTYEKNHDDFISSLTDRLHRKLCAVERVGVAKVDKVYELFHSVATPTWQQQEVFKPNSYDSDDSNDDNRDMDTQDMMDGDESSEYDEDVDIEYIQMRAQEKAKARIKAKSRRQRSEFHVTDSEITIRNGILEYFAEHSGEGIGGIGAEDELFQKKSGTDNEVENLESNNTSTLDKTIQLYTYENALVNNLQKKWRSAVEVDLKVFLNQHWQQMRSSEQNSSMKGIESPRAVCRIFHGISSPRFPALEWSRTKYWSKHMHFDFAQLMQMADRIFKEQRQQRLSK